MADSQEPSESGGGRPLEPGDATESWDDEWHAEQSGESGDAERSRGREDDDDHEQGDAGESGEAQGDDLEESDHLDETDDAEQADETDESDLESGSTADTDRSEGGQRKQVATVDGEQNTVVQVAGDVFGRAERPEFRLVAPRELERARAVFVAPPGYQRVAMTPLEEAHPRVFLVHGPDHSGKRTCAANLAQALVHLLTPKAGAVVSIQQYARPERSEISLADAITAKRLPRDAVILLDDCFKRNVGAEELEPFPIGALRAALGSANSLLVLTGELGGEQLAAVSAIKLDARVDLRDVLRTNLRYSVEHEGLPITPNEIESLVEPRLWHQLERLLATPFHVGQLCSRLRDALAQRKSHKPLHAVVLEAAKVVAVVGRQAARAWFDSLPTNNDKLFGPLVYLFAGADRQWLEQLTRQVVQRLRADGLGWLSDPREHGLDDALDRLQLGDRGGSLVFADASYLEEIRRQLANRHHLLWDAMSEASDPQLVPAEAESWKRQALGMALGRLGPHDPERLVSTLVRLAGEQDQRRAVIPGYALEELARSESPLDVHLALRILSGWVQSGDARLMWAAAAAVWRVFRVHARKEAPAFLRLGDRVVELLGTLGLELRQLRPARKGELARREVERGLVQAMREVVLADPNRGGEEILRWLRTGKPRRRLALAVIRSLCVGLARSHSKMSEAQVSCLLRWVAPLLATSTDTPAADLVLLTLRSSLSVSGVPDQIGRALLRLSTHERSPVGERLRTALTRLWLEPRSEEAVAVAKRLLPPPGKKAGQIDPKQRREINRLLTRWCDGNEAAARRIARTVIARSYAVDGALPSVPISGRAVVVVDPDLLAAGRVEASSDARRALWRLLALLDSRFELGLLRLGEPAMTALSDRLADVQLMPDFPTHRLIMPGLSRIAADGGAQLFVLGVHPPQDLDDVRDLPAICSVCCIGPAFGGDPTVDGDHGDSRIDLPWPPTGDQLDAVETALENRFSRGLAAAPAELWLDLLWRCGVARGDEHDWTALLGGWSAALDQLPDEPVPANEPVWRSVVLLLFLHASDPELALAWIASRLIAASSQERTNEGVIARAAALALIRLATAYPASDAGNTRPSTRLFDVLADPLGRQGADGAAAVVRLVIHCIDDPVWSGHLAGDVRLGKGRFERWAAVHLEHEPMLAEDLSRRLAANRLGLEDDWVALTAALDRLRARQALEHPGALPELQADERFAVLVVNTASEPGASERHLAALAGPLCRELSARSAGRLVPAIFRLGETQPYWTTVAERPITERLLGPGIRLPPLLGPLLARLDIERVAVVVLLSSSPPIDIDDWVETRWWSKVRLYPAGNGQLLASFATLPRPLTEAGSAVAPRAEEEEMRKLAALLDDPTAAGGARAVPSST